MKRGKMAKRIKHSKSYSYKIKPIKLPRIRYALNLDLIYGKNKKKQKQK